MGRPARSVIGILILLALCLPAALPALAQESDTSIGGTLTRPEGEERVPVEGVVFVVTENGDEIGTGTSGPDGIWEVPLPGAGEYDVALQVDTLPVGVEPTDPERTELTDISIREGQTRQVIFQLGEGSAGGVSTYSRLASLFVTGLKLGAIIALSSVGLSLVFGVTGLVNFSHGELVSFGAVVAFFFHAAGLEWPLVLAAIPAILLGAALGWGQEKVLWHPLRRRGMGLISMIVISIGLSFVIRFLILIFYGGLPRAYPGYAGQGAVQFLGFSLVPKQVVTIVVSLIILVGVGLFLEKTRAGTALRAVRDSPDLSESSGINVNKVIALTWTLGAALAAIGGVFFGLTESVQWDMGFRLLLLMFAAVILGGLGTAYGAMVGGFVVGIAVEMSTLFIPTEIKNVVGLGLLIIVLLVRPQGILGVRERVG
ncbi:MAG: branched-chain amino acid ABC transporter permease [Actinomycetota bacterium]